MPQQKWTILDRDPTVIVAGVDEDGDPLVVARAVAGRTTLGLNFAHSAMSATKGRANARLIAAAPDLYQALDNLIGRFEAACRHTGSDDEFIAEATKVHRAALAKARGETP